MSDSNWNKTRIMLERKEQEDNIEWIEGEPHYQGRHIIERDADIEGGVYLGGGEREAIVVDSEYGAIPELYEDAKDTAEELAQENNSTISTYAPLAAFRTVQDAFSPSEEQLEHLVSRYGDIEDLDDGEYRGVETEEDLRNPSYLVTKISEDLGVEEDGKVALDTFVNKDIGVCRHQALAAGAVLEHFQEDGYIDGDISVDRNQDSRGGHAWVRYEDQNRVRILDSTQDVFSPLGLTEDSFWDYARPEDNI